MRVVAWRWLSVIAFASLLAPALAGAPTETSAADSRAWLGRIHKAANESNYQGTLVYSANGVLSSSRVAHFCVGSQSYERLESLDGRQQRIYRLNDVVHTLWPQAHLAVIEKRGVFSNLPSSTQTVEPRALEQYEFRAEGADRVAGRDALVFLLQPRDEMRYAQRLWADKATGLMLRADVIGPGRQVLESTAFSEVEIGVRPQPDSVTQALRRLDGYRIVRPMQQHTQLEAEGWSLAKPVAGFKFAACMKRSLEAPDAPSNAPVLQAVFSDGVTQVSLFIEAYDGRTTTAPIAPMGATNTLRQRRGDHLITVMGDVPVGTLQAFSEALERKH